MPNDLIKVKPIWEIVSEIGAQIPEEEWEQVPSDLSKELDHYLYGTPRSENINERGVKCP